MATRRKVVTARIADDLSAVEYDIHGPLNAETGKFPVVDTVRLPASAVPEDRQVWFMLYGVSQVLATRYNRLDEDATPGDVKIAVLEVLDAIADGTWAPGRSFAEREPTDLELAIAEATNTPVADIIDRIENTYEKNGDGTDKLDKAGRKSRVFNKRMLDALAQDAKIKPILARLVAERAKRLAADSKKPGTDLLGSLFAPTPPASPREPVPETAAAAN